MDELVSEIEALYMKYESSPYMLNRLSHHVLSILPTTLESEASNYEKRIERTTQMLLEQDNFIQAFLSKNAVFYLSSNNSYYLYDGISYSFVEEEKLQHTILTSISEHGSLMPWKYKTKQHLMRIIKKERPLLKSVPESITIDNIVSRLYPNFCSTKEEALFLLTIVGDNLLKKYSEEEEECIYYVVTCEKNKPKKILIELDTIVNSAVAIHVTTNIVTKYHTTYNFDRCRILRFHHGATNMWCNELKNFIQLNMMDFLCVCAYFSERFLNTEHYILSCGNEEFQERTLYMKGKTNKDIFDSFCSTCIESKEGDTVPWKSLHYIWKIFILQQGLPNMIYSQVLKDLLKSAYSYDESTDSFQHLTSKMLPNISAFLSFWETTIQVDYNSELEIEEIVVLFNKLYMKTQNAQQLLSEDEILKLLHHYFPHVEVFDKKYILNSTCLLWDKNKEIVQTLAVFKETYSKKKTKDTYITFDSIYTFYTKQKTATKLFISKRYFEKYMDDYLGEHIIFEKRIHINWLNE
jgi:hypothetical protein